MSYESANNTYFKDQCLPEGPANEKCTYVAAEEGSIGGTWTLLQDISINNLGAQTPAMCIRLGPGEIFDGNGYTITVTTAATATNYINTAAPGVFRIDASSNPYGQNNKAHSSSNKDKCTIQNLTVDAESGAHVYPDSGGFIQLPLSSSPAGGLGLYLKNCITKRVTSPPLSGQTQNGGFTPRGWAVRQNISYVNCIVEYPEDLKDVRYVDGGLGAEKTGRTSLFPNTFAGGGLESIYVSGCIAYIQFSSATPSITPTTGVTGKANSLTGAMFGKLSFTGDSTPPANFSYIENCYLLMRIGETYSSHGLNRDDGTFDFTGVTVPHDQLTDWGWRPHVEGTVKADYGVDLLNTNVVSNTVLEGLHPAVAAAAQAAVADAAESKAITLISTANITGIKAMVPGSINNGKAFASPTGGNTLRSIMDTEGTGEEKRNRRRAALKLMFAQSTFSAVKMMVFEKADLVLPAAFDASKVLVIKAGQTFVIGDLSDNEGFYSVLDDGEKVSYTISDDSTVTFTRNDVSDNEQYDLSGGNVINVDKVTIGTLDSSGNGHLRPGDIVGIDGRDFFIGSVGDGGGSGSGGDPYVYPINSSVPVKLPNKRANYRMFEQGNNYINVEVKRATQDHRDRMLSYAEMITHETHNIVCDGFFYHKAFISAEGHTLLIDYMSKKMSCSAGALDFFTIKQIKKKFTEGEFGDDCKCMKIAWKTKEGKKIHAEIMFFPNPHIENGINVIPETTRGSTGLIVTNYKPKLMKLPSITTLKYDKLHRRLANTKNVFQKKAIKGKNEKWHLKK